MYYNKFNLHSINNPVEKPFPLVALDFSAVVFKVFIGIVLVLTVLFCI